MAPYKAQYVGMPDAEVFIMPMKLCLELMAVIRPHFTNAEWEFFDDVVNEIDRVCLRVFFIDFQGANPGCNHRLQYTGSDVPSHRVSL